MPTSSSASLDTPSALFPVRTPVCLVCNPHVPRLHPHVGRLFFMSPGLYPWLPSAVPRGSHPSAPCLPTLGRPSLSFQSFCSRFHRPSIPRPCFPRSRHAHRHLVASRGLSGRALARFEQTPWVLCFRHRNVMTVPFFPICQASKGKKRITIRSWSRDSSSVRNLKKLAL